LFSGAPIPAQRLAVVALNYFAADSIAVGEGSLSLGITLLGRLDQRLAPIEEFCRK